MRDYFLTTKRMGFSQWTNDDLELARKLWGNEKVTRFLCATGKFTESDIQQRLNLEIENNENYGVQYWPVFNLLNEEFIGCCGLRPYNLEEKVYEIGETAENFV